jgi:hypothetical protein
MKLLITLLNFLDYPYSQFFYFYLDAVNRPNPAPTSQKSTPVQFIKSGLTLL